MNTFTRLILAFIALSFSTFAQAASTQTSNNSSFTQAQQTEIQNIVHDYLLKNPQILLETIGKLQEQTDKKNQAKVQKVISTNANALLKAPYAPVFGNPNGTVTLIEFFDYQCPYCKRVSSSLSKLAQTNSNLRIVMKEWPVFGEASEFAARAALAAQQQNKYQPFHQALMAIKGNRLTKTEVLTVAKNTGLDMTKLQADMSSKPVMDELKNNLMLAHALQLVGTPVFIITKTNGSHDDVIFIPGAADPETLQNAIKKVG